MPPTTSDSHLLHATADDPAAPDSVDSMSARMLAIVRRAGPTAGIEIRSLLGAGGESEETVTLAWRVIRGGFVCDMGDKLAGVRHSFAGICCALDRVQVLADVVREGLPGWEFHGAEHTRAAFLDDLCSYRVDGADVPIHRNLMMEALFPEGPHTKPALRLMLEVVPNHPYFSQRWKEPAKQAVVDQAAIEFEIEKAHGQAAAGTSAGDTTVRSKVAPSRRSRVL